ncbi:MAG: response regulator [Desulfuromonadales bacterium]
MTELALDTELDNAQYNFLHSIKISGENLLGIINDILDFSKIEVGRIDLEETPFLLRTMIGQALRAIASRASEKGLEVAFYAEPDVPDALLGDPGRLRQILLNLVGNAVKFSSKGTVEVLVTLAGCTDTTARLCFRVNDQGAGIPHHFQERIFDAFEQGDSSTTKRFGGTGLGLAISKRLVALMDGEISVESEPGVGSTFRFTASFRLQTEIPDCPAITPLSSISVLVVDDVAINRKLFAGLLANWGMQVQLADDGEEALSLLSRTVATGNPPRLLLVDAHMPDMDGWEVSRRVRAESVFQQVRIIIMPSCGKRGDAQRCRELGIEGYLTKPVIQEELHDALVAVLQGVSIQSHIPVTRHSVIEERSRCSVLIVDDVEINREMVRVTLEKQGHRVSMACDGSEAVEACRTATFDIIFMDMQMPVMDGYEATTKIKLMHGQRKILTPIVAMTAYALQSDRDKCLAAGADDYLPKPAKPVEIIAMLNKLVVRQQENDRHPAPADTPASAANVAGHSVALAVFNPEDFKERLGGHSEMFGRFIGMFKKGVAENLVALRTAVESGDSGRTHVQAHTIKGAAANITAEKIRATATALDDQAKAGEMAGAMKLVERLEEEFAEFVRETGEFTDPESPHRYL